MTEGQSTLFNVVTGREDGTDHKVLLHHQSGNVSGVCAGVRLDCEFAWSARLPLTGTILFPSVVSLQREKAAWLLRTADSATSTSSIMPKGICGVDLSTFIFLALCRWAPSAWSRAPSGRCRKAATDDCTSRTRCPAMAAHRAAARARQDIDGREAVDIMTTGAA